MTLKVKTLPSAQRDVLLSAKWYNRKQKDLGKDFISRVKEAKKILEVNPYFVKRYKNIHTLPLEQFPFLIHFVVDEKMKVVTIYAILHTSLNPDKYPE